MATVKVPGVGKSTGSKPFEAYVPGKYKVEFNGVKLIPKRNDKGSGTSWEFKMTILESPEQANGKSVDGRPLTLRVFIMNDDHQSFEEWGYIGVDELKSMALAAGISIKGDSIDPEAFVGEKAVVTLAQETSEYKGEQRTNNVAKKWEAA